MSRAKKDGTFLNCYIKREIAEEVSAYCDSTGLPKTTVVEKALSTYMQLVDPGTELYKATASILRKKDYRIVVSEVED